MDSEAVWRAPSTFLAAHHGWRAYRENVLDWSIEGLQPTASFFVIRYAVSKSLFENFAWHWTSTHVLSAQTNNRSIPFLTPARSLIFTPFLFKRKIPFDDNSNTQFFLRIERFLGQHSLDAGLNQLENNFVSRLVYEHLSLKEYCLKTFQVF